MLRLYNTATRALEDFAPLTPGVVTMYNCGPTVYDFAHVGNLRPYVFADILRRTLEQSGYKVEQVVNITDVGHLVSDGDEGDDKMTKALKREGLPLTLENMLMVGEQYTAAFKGDLTLLNIKIPELMPKASAHIPEQIALISTLMQKGFAYTTSDGVYFDTEKFPDYGKMAKLDLAGQREGARVEINKEKRNPIDFSLWKFNVDLGWEAPWGRGFPGWHIECSAMAMKYLGETLDSHTGGVDHIPVHHTNEIAQSEAATGKQFARFWMHSAHMTVEGEKMSKSLGNTFTLEDLKKRGISPLAFRYWLLTASYHTQVNFTWEALEGAQQSYDSLRKKIFLARNTQPSTYSTIAGSFEQIGDDLNTAAVIARVWSLVQGQSYLPQSVIERLDVADKILGLKLLEWEPEKIDIPVEIQELANAREVSRKEKNWAESDRLRDAIVAKGWGVKDTPDGPLLTPLQ